MISICGRWSTVVSCVGSVDVLRAALQIWPVELTSIGMMSLVVWRCLFCCDGLTAAAAVPLIERL